jgi:hypothetical protein
MELFLTMVLSLLKPQVFCRLVRVAQTTDPETIDSLGGLITLTRSYLKSELHLVYFLVRSLRRSRGQDSLLQNPVPMFLSFFMIDGCPSMTRLPSTLSSDSYSRVMCHYIWVLFWVLNRFRGVSQQSSSSSKPWGPTGCRTLTTRFRLVGMQTVKKGIAI